MVACVMSPSFRRTHWPSFRSIAGKSIMMFRSVRYAKPSGLPAQEIGYQGKAEFLALLGVKLRTHHSVTSDECGHCATIIRRGDDIARVQGGQVIRVHEVGVQTLAPCGNAVEKWMG